MRIFLGLIAIIVGAIVLAILTVDSWLVIGERAQGGHAPRTAAEQTAAEERAKASQAEAIKAADEAMNAIDGHVEDGMAGRKGTAH
ncbi:hypothetical protein [Shinella granuli]|uniref:hypothetical protein n=1 Tax=Shinella granuli TaxID=323621 RepID=UPI001055630A|nr:hypothetical protein [Shinella granuli]